MGDELEPWQTRAPGAFLTIRAGGPWSGIVTISAEESALVVRATWAHERGERATTVGLSQYKAATAQAREWADQLAAGIEPSSDA